ncbi:hypothetical protein CM1200mP19_1770 [bacterium]|nr:MAG: hypothetical protein CM1200mP19_1770 [bacterium]
MVRSVTLFAPPPTMRGQHRPVQPCRLVKGDGKVNPCSPGKTAASSILDQRRGTRRSRLPMNRIRMFRSATLFDGPAESPR